MKNLLLYASPISMHIHPSSPNSSISEENAATKIQANFRGYRVRKQMKDSSPTGAGHHHHSSAVLQQQHADADNSSKRGGAAEHRDESATKIQAGIRGYLVRKKQKLAADAATKIQANFRGFKTRQDLKKNSDK